LGDYLYHQGKDKVFWRVVEKEDVSTLLLNSMKAFVEVILLDYIKKDLLKKVSLANIFKDAMGYCKTCDVCQTFANKFVVHTFSLEEKHVFFISLCN